MENVDFVVTHLKKNGLVRYEDRSNWGILEFPLPKFTPEVFFGDARQICLEHCSSELTMDQEQALHLLAEVVGLVPRQVEHALQVFKTYVRGFHASIASGTPLERERFLSSFLQESIGQTTPNDLSIICPEDLNPP